MMEKTTSDAIAYRRSVRLYKNQNIDSEKVKQCLRNASIAPTSSNLQLWEFHHIISKDKMAKISRHVLIKVLQNLHNKWLFLFPEKIYGKTEPKLI